MLILYNLSIRIYHLLIIIYQHFNPKAHQWIEGRKNIFEKISNEVDPTTPSIWFHFASLGEFEQGRPVLERARESYPAYKIIITFFSPSGYELRKNYKNADHIFYLPLDTNVNAEKFVKLINPKLVIFTKYEFWYHYFNELNKQNIPLVVISAIFRKSQAYFKWYGSLNKKILRFVDHFFVQDENSKQLLAGIEINNVTVSGDTRFDRVFENAGSPKHFDDVRAFCDNSKTFVAGSTWPADEKLIADIVHQYPDWKFIIAPHEIKEEKIQSLIGMLGEGKTIRYSSLNLTRSSRQVLIIDNIGMLSALYQYGDIAYIGGGFGVGIHNTLEAAAFGIPVIFGPNYYKFIEARELVRLEAGFSINNDTELFTVMHKLQDLSFREKAGNTAKQYVDRERGATEKILSYIDTIILK